MSLKLCKTIGLVIYLIWSFFFFSLMVFMIAHYFILHTYFMRTTRAEAVWNEVSLCGYCIWTWIFCILAWLWFRWMIRCKRVHNVNHIEKKLVALVIVHIHLLCISLCVGEWSNKWTPGITNSLPSAQLFLPSDILQYSYSFHLFQWPSPLFTKLCLIFFFSLWWIFSKYSEKRLMLPDFHPAF